MDLSPLANARRSFTDGGLPVYIGYDDEQEAVKSLKESEQEAASPGTIGDLIKAQMEQ